ncbi:2,3-bisphosphoglycerate-dependent phosphoglycerate mutase [Sphaceloma murrayae]|uniref:2,3-bisphosphoglycerate-dependent phosphoglycerate mutase n=1 Tax=Sphaceloma murrayae TaxID=2082308 RepID=A0A2K1QQ81_9PEZI|nr:2,3-bisphosphoglycerate-dependent phosphoglycerate mutase [Sphaceloma murrayae]
MLVFFIRHGETVDNVAGVYAGVRDSELTNHGLLQAQQLAAYLKKTRPSICTIFASPLQRARRTAEAILDAQNKFPPAEEPFPAAKLDELNNTSLEKTPLLIEQDFGFYEGKPFYARSSDTSQTGKAVHYEKHKQDPGFQDVETKESLAKRGDSFLDEYLIPAVLSSENEDMVFAVVSHGIMLSHLWRRFLLRLPKKSVTVAPEVTAAKGQIILEHLGGYSNTGFLEISLTKQVPSADSAASTTDNIDVPTPLGKVQDSAGASADNSKSPAVMLSDYTVNVLTVNGQEHLKGIKRARGGIGSAKYDEGQKSLDSFFKKTKK